MKRKTPLRVTGRLRSGSALPKRNRKRAAERKERDFGEYAAWIRHQMCSVGVGECHYWGGCFTVGADGVVSWSVAAHVKSRGAGGRSIGNLIPLCTGHHDEQHAIGIKSFAKKYNLDLSGVASALAARYTEETDG